MNEPSPEILVVAGPNGAGKSTCVSRYLPEGMAFLNADEVAKKLPGYPSPSADIQAGRIVLSQMDDFEERRESFAVETTLAARSLASRIVRLRQAGYHLHLVYVWSPSADFSVRRVDWRVRSGGHHIPEDTIRRRYSAGIKNFFGLYQPIADVWDVLDNSSPDGPRLVATSRLGGEAEIQDSEIWNRIRQRGIDGTE
jgi:predicted ABC-type ATPase